MDYVSLTALNIWPKKGGQKIMSKLFPSSSGSNNAPLAWGTILASCTDGESRSRRRLHRSKGWRSSSWCGSKGGGGSTKSWSWTAKSWRSRAEWVAGWCRRWLSSKVECPCSRLQGGSGTGVEAWTWLLGSGCCCCIGGVCHFNLLQKNLTSNLGSQ